MALKVAQRAHIPPFHVMEFVAAAIAQEQATGDVIHLEVGQPSTGAPEPALARARGVMGEPRLMGYTPACGTDELRDGVARLYVDRHQLSIDRREVIITSGASGACVLALLAAFDVGDRVGVTEPGYPCYRQMISALGMTAVPIRAESATGFRLTEALLDSTTAQTGPLDGLIIASPANPTGTVYDAAQLSAITEWCARGGVRLVADEIYHGITFGDPVPSARQFSPDSIVIGSFSKYFSMTGWRLGWLLAPEELVEPIDRLSQNLYLCPGALAQHVGRAALDCTDELDRHVERYRTNRDVLLNAFAQLGIGETAPSDGAFYLYGAVDHWGLDSSELCQRWLREIGVAVTPGIDFDPVDGRRWARWSFAGSTESVTEGARRLVGWAKGA